ncbi:MAG TPA: MFS transporter [Solirubrobacteraceae bacterium]|nr:MFS transporter [Solirubrobacteraceae bacterium]
MIAAAATPHADRASYRLVLTILFASGLIYTVLVTLVVPAVHVLAAGIGGSDADATWILTTFVLSGSVATPIAGRLGDMYGRKRALVVVLVIVLVGVLLCAVSTSFIPLTAGRVLAGVSSGVFPLAYGILRDEYEGERVAVAIGIMSISIGIGTGAGFLLSGLIIRSFSYHWLFWFPLALVVPTMIATMVYVPESPKRPGGSVDWFGGALLTGGLLALLVAISEAQTWGWGSARTLGLLAAGLAVLVAWTAVEARTAEPLIDMETMGIPAVWRTNAVAFLLGVGLFAGFAVIPQFAEQPASTGYGFADSVLTAGLFLVPATVGMVMIGPLAGMIEARWGSKVPLVAGSAVSAIGFLMIAVADSTAWHIYVATGLFGVGMGLAYAAMPNIILEACPGEQTGAATSINTIMRVIGGALGIQVCETLVAQHTSAAGLPTNHGFELAYWVCTIGLVAATIVAALVPGRRRLDVSASATELA